jgi:hypothetical protein
VTAVGGRTDPVVTAGPVIVVYSGDGSIASSRLALRLAAAASALVPGERAGVRLEPASELGGLDQDWLATATALVVSPSRRDLSGLPALSVLRRARRLVAVVGDHDDADWPALVCGSGLDVDAILDIGFAPREHGHRLVARIFLHNAPSAAETALIRSRVAGGRPLPWALVGHATPARVVLADALTKHLAADGIVFLPSDRPERSGGGGARLGAVDLTRLLEATTYYVWCSRTGAPYYESHRFLDAVLAGAVPCKIEPSPSVREALAGMPAVYRSVSELAEASCERGPESLYEDAREYCLGSGTLEDLLPGALERVPGAAVRA